MMLRSTVISQEKATDKSDGELTTSQNLPTCIYSFPTADDPGYDDLRAEAALHAKLRTEAFKKAAMARSRKQGDVAQYYAQQVVWCTAL